MTIQITQTSESGYQVYKFSANNTDYEILTTDAIEYTVYSSQKGRSGRTTPKVYDSLAALAKRSKALAGFAQLIAA